MSETKSINVGKSSSKNRTSSQFDEDEEGAEIEDEDEEEEEEDEKENLNDKVAEYDSIHKPKPVKKIKKQKVDKKFKNSSTTSYSTITVNVSSTQYDVVPKVMQEIFKFQVTTDTESDWDLFWADTGVTPEMVTKLKPYQKINHFAGMSCLARKNFLGRNLMKMRKLFPKEYKFFPQTWILPLDLYDFKLQFNKNRNKTYIIKPEALSQGKGIFLTRNYESVDTSGHYVAQRYIHKPLLIDGLKFDLRIYVLVYGCDPLRIFVYREGLARLATEQYKSPNGNNLDNLYMHLTNYAINKNSEKFIFNEDPNNAEVGHKRSLSSIWKYIDEHGGDSLLIFDQIKKNIVKTLCSVQPILAHTYRSCQPNDLDNNKSFEILGFDILIDHKFKPWLIEVNHSPSFTTDTPYDYKIKSELISNVIRILNFREKDKAKYFATRAIPSKFIISKKRSDQLKEKENIKIQKMKKRNKYEMENLGNFDLVYPDSDNDYEPFIKAAANEDYSNNNKNKSSKSKAPNIKNVNQLNRPEVCKFPNTKSKIANEANGKSRLTNKVQMKKPLNQGKSQNQFNQNKKNVNGLVKTNEETEKIIFGPKKKDTIENSLLATTNNGSSDALDKGDNSIEEKQDYNNHFEDEKIGQSKLTSKMVEIISNYSLLKTFEPKENEETKAGLQHFPLIQNELNNSNPPNLVNKELIPNNLNNKNQNSNCHHQLQILKKNNVDQNIDKKVSNSYISKRKSSK